MNIMLYNSRTRQKEVFVPLGDKVRMYVCGPTVYNRAHIGNARPVVVFDVLYRLLSHLYPDVIYVRNITDVDDKIITAAEEQKVDINVLTTKTTEFFHQDMAALNALLPTIEPRATEHIQDMLDMIQSLINQGYAYEKEGHVLFSVKKFDHYGTLSKKNQEDLLAGARVEIAPYKEYAGDFVLWKPSLDNQPGWDSPFGYGRPGWHIECSAMSKRYLGETFDIHGGGIDLIFPHHENENAQSCCAHQTPFMANFWLHNGHVTVQGAKMSKSLNNFITVEELRNKTDPEIIRMALLSSHYRQPLDFTQDLLDKCKADLDRFYIALKNYDETLPIIDEEVLNILTDDLNTPSAISYMHALTSTLNKENNAIAAAKLKGMASLLGILHRPSKEWLQKGASLSEEEILTLIEERNTARKNKDFKKSDEIRDLLSKKGIILEDLKGNTTWKTAY